MDELVDYEWLVPNVSGVFALLSHLLNQSEALFFCPHSGPAVLIRVISSHAGTFVASGKSHLSPTPAPPPPVPPPSIHCCCTAKLAGLVLIRWGVCKLCRRKRSAIILRLLKLCFHRLPITFCTLHFNSGGSLRLFDITRYRCFVSASSRLIQMHKDSFGHKGLMYLQCEARVSFRWLERMT